MDPLLPGTLHILRALGVFKTIHVGDQVLKSQASSEYSRFKPQQGLIRAEYGDQEKKMIEII